MELLFVVVIAAGLGLGVRMVVPGRSAYGANLIPAIAAATAAVVWVALLWLGWTFDGTWIWVLTIVAAVLTSTAVAVILPKRRAESDARMLAELSGTAKRTA